MNSGLSNIDSVEEINGGAGRDTVRVDDSRSNYTLRVSGDTIELHANDNPAASPVALNEVEVLRFNDATIDLTKLGSSNLIDGSVAGIEYTTSSGLSGLTDENGGFAYLEGDTITFSVGGVILGEATAEDVSTGQTFLQDIADVARTDLNDEYTENMATFLQSLDNNGNAADGIGITEETREALADVQLDLRTATEAEVQQVVEQVGKTWVNEEKAMEHVEEMLVKHTDLTPDDFQEHQPDAPAGATGSNMEQASLSSLAEHQTSTPAAMPLDDNQGIALEVPSIDLDNHQEVPGPDSSREMASVDPAEQASDTGTVHQAMEQATGPTTDHLGTEISIGDLHDQMPSAILGGEKPPADSDMETGQEQTSAVARGADNPEPEDSHSFSEATQEQETSHHASRSQAAESQSDGAQEAVATDTHEAESASSAQSHTHQSQIDAQPSPLIGQTPSIALNEGEAAHGNDQVSGQELDHPDSAAAPESLDTGYHEALAAEGHAEQSIDQTSLDHFSATETAQDGLEQFAATDGGVGQTDVDQFTVTDHSTAMDEIPPMDGLDVTPDQPDLPDPEPADAGLGAEDAVMADDIQDPPPAHDDVIAA